MTLFFLTLLIAVPLLEIYIFVQVGSQIGGLWTVVLTIATALFGLSLMRRQGLAVVAEARQRLERGEAPVREAANGILLLFAGVCLLTPGFATDTVGFLLLWRPIRGFLLASLLEMSGASFFTQMRPQKHQKPPKSSDSGDSQNPTTKDKIIEGTYWSDDDDKPA